MKADEIIKEAPEQPAAGGQEKDPMWYKLHKKSQALGQKVSGVANVPGVDVGLSLAKQLGSGVMQGLDSPTSGTDPIGLGGFRHVEPGATAQKPSAANTVVLMDPTTKKPVKYTLQGKYWYSSDGTAVNDAQTVEVLNQQIAAQQRNQ